MLHLLGSGPRIVNTWNDDDTPGVGFRTVGRTVTIPQTVTGTSTYLYWTSNVPNLRARDGLYTFSYRYGLNIANTNEVATDTATGTYTVEMSYNFSTWTTISTGAGLTNFASGAYTGTVLDRTIYYNNFNAVTSFLYFRSRASVSVTLVNSSNDITGDAFIYMFATTADVDNYKLSYIF